MDESDGEEEEEEEEEEGDAKGSAKEARGSPIPSTSDAIEAPAAAAAAEEEEEAARAARGTFLETFFDTRRTTVLFLG